MNGGAGARTGDRYGRMSLDLLRRCPMLDLRRLYFPTLIDPHSVSHLDHALEGCCARDGGDKAPPEIASRHS
jgi:hypothetical protein